MKYWIKFVFRNGTGQLVGDMDETDVAEAMRLLTDPADHPITLVGMANMVITEHRSAQLVSVEVTRA